LITGHTAQPKRLAEQAGLGDSTTPLSLLAPPPRPLGLGYPRAPWAPLPAASEWPVGIIRGGGERRPGGRMLESVRGTRRGTEGPAGNNPYHRPSNQRNTQSAERPTDRMTKPSHQTPNRASFKPDLSHDGGKRRSGWVGFSWSQTSEGTKEEMNEEWAKGRQGTDQTDRLEGGGGKAAGGSNARERQKERNKGTKPGFFLRPGGWSGRDPPRRGRGYTHPPEGGVPGTPKIGVQKNST